LVPTCLAADRDDAERWDTRGFLQPHVGTGVLNLETGKWSLEAGDCKINCVKKENLKHNTIMKDKKLIWKLSGEMQMKSFSGADQLKAKSDGYMRSWFRVRSKNPVMVFAEKSKYTLVPW
jgi:hypothetical protein